MKKYRVTRLVSQSECKWLDFDVAKGAVVYEFQGHTYGCISDGVAVSIEPNKNPFFELPEDSIEVI